MTTISSSALIHEPVKDPQNVSRSNFMNSAIKVVVALVASAVAGIFCFFYPNRTTNAIFAGSIIATAGVLFGISAESTKLLPIILLSKYLP